MVSGKHFSSLIIIIIIIKRILHWICMRSQRFRVSRQCKKEMDAALYRTGLHYCGLHSGPQEWRRSKSDLKTGIAAHQSRMLKAFITDVHENKPKSPSCVRVLFAIKGSGPRLACVRFTNSLYILKKN